MSPFLVVCILRKQKFPLGHPKLKASIGTLYQNVDTVDKPYALLFTPIFLLRRLMFASVAVMSENATVQLFVTIYCSLALIAFYVIVWPMNDTVNNVLQLGNEIFFLVCVHVMLTFTEFTTDPVKRHEIGATYLYFLALNVTVNVALIGYTIIKQVIDYCRKRKQEQPKPKPEKKPSDKETTDVNLPNSSPLMLEMLQDYEMTVNQTPS